MLENFFEDETRMRQMRVGPMGEHVDRLAEFLWQENYARGTGRMILSIIGKFSRFAEEEGVTSAGTISEELIDKFTSEELAFGGVFHSGCNAMTHMMNYLRREGMIAPAPKKEDDDPFLPLLKRYENNLRNTRGLSRSTINHYTRTARLFLGWLSDKRGNKPVGKISGSDVLDFVSDFILHQDSCSCRNNFCSETRCFLRFLLWDEIIDTDLSRVVPRVPRYRLSTVPCHLPWEIVQTLISSIDTSRPVGKRDKAILLLLACLGMRATEVLQITFGQIDWRRAEIHIPKSKNLRERVLPLSQETGDALADYVFYGRPMLSIPQVFLRAEAPRTPLESHTAISSIVRRNMIRAGISASEYGAHMLRHSLATRMVNSGVPIKNISDILGHVKIDTTAIYTKVDTVHLAAVALPFPGGVA